MSNLDLLIQAVNTKRPISFEYNKPGKTPGKRIGNTHAVFIFTSKADEKSTKVHLVQTAGVTDSVVNFPDFRMFNIEHLSNIEILDSEPEFEPYMEKYNPEWEGYKDVIAKV